ncbi:hypothetical protein [Actinoalloteichus sp. GBA129-24]|uniref:hypothetical protein n=1 Tax=Actinoalloteichus sp. GBA129-24 TaxID=1612551 RepID=UPI0009504CD3|nr:hypothetical protein [Actinoalloteichus sp. GBA129-24]APU20941.1 hypothetical protein UA75_14655 [Actinoalloteichus sp. GBA129-24]APU24190.1 hypothetical protein UA75_31135 [Actinoalloteichus sp. GBA129-24]
MPDTDAPTPDESGTTEAAATAVTESLGDPGKAALSAERKRANEAERKLKEFESRVREFEDRDKSDLERASAERERLQAELATERATRLRLSVAAEHDIPRDYHHLLTASSEEELTAQAKTVSELVALKAAPQFAANPAQGKRSAESSTPTLEGGAAAYADRFGTNK